MGTPVELYEFTQGSSRWYYTTAADGFVRAGRTYKASPIVRGRVKQSGDVFKNSLSLSFPRLDEFARQFIGFAPEAVTTVTILRGHAGDPSNEFVVYWKGRVVGGKASGNVIDVECESIFTSIKRVGLRARFELGCRHSLYSVRCGVARGLYKASGTLLYAGSGVVVSMAVAALKPDGYYTGGLLLTSGGASRFILVHTGASLTMSRPVEDLVSGSSADIFAGCDHLRGTCLTKFNNIRNFGGFPYIPQRNPFDGSSIT